MFLMKMVINYCYTFFTSFKLYELLLRKRERDSFDTISDFFLFCSWLSMEKTQEENNYFYFPHIKQKKTKLKNRY